MSLSANEPLANWNYNLLLPESCTYFTSATIFTDQKFTSPKHKMSEAYVKILLTKPYLKTRRSDYEVGNSGEM